MIVQFLQVPKGDEEIGPQWKEAIFVNLLPPLHVVLTAYRALAVAPAEVATDSMESAVSGTSTSWRSKGGLPPPGRKQEVVPGAARAQGSEGPSAFRNF